MPGRRIRKDAGRTKSAEPICDIRFTSAALRVRPNRRAKGFPASPFMRKKCPPKALFEEPLTMTGWTQLTPAFSPQPLQGASLAYDPTTQTVVLFGGSLNRLAQSGGVNSNQTWTWDGVTWTQQFPPISPPARAWNADGRLCTSITPEPGPAWSV